MDFIYQHLIRHGLAPNDNYYDVYTNQWKVPMFEFQGKLKKPVLLN